MKTLLHTTSVSLLLLLIVVNSSCENYISFADEVALPAEEVPASDGFTLGAAFLASDTTLWLRTDRALNFLTGYTRRTSIRSNWPLVDEEDLMITLFEDSEELTHFEHIPEAMRYANSDDFSDSLQYTWPLYTTTSNYDAKLNNRALEEGRTYRLLVEHPRLGNYEITQVMPEKVTNIRTTAGSFVSGEIGSSSYQPITLNFERSGSDNRYFIVEVFNEFGVNNTVSTVDPRVPGSTAATSSALLLEVADDSDTSVTLVFRALGTPGEPVKTISITAVSEGWYRFLASYNLFFELSSEINDGLTEPFQVYSNVPNGFGVFGLGNQARAEVE